MNELIIRSIVKAVRHLDTFGTIRFGREDIWKRGKRSKRESKKVVIAQSVR